jgi:signal transduction histidine kinase
MAPQPGLALVCVPIDERARVFGRFTRGTAAADRAGSGIGLTIVEAVARSHGGDVAIEDTLRGGATFVVRLPLRSG